MDLSIAEFTPNAPNYAEMVLKKYIDVESEVKQHDDDTKLMAEEIRAIRIARGFSQIELAKLIRLPIDMLKIYEKGVIYPDKTTIMRLQKALNYKFVNP